MRRICLTYDWYSVRRRSKTNLTVWCLCDGSDCIEFSFATRLGVVISLSLSRSALEVRRLGHFSPLERRRLRRRFIFIIHIYLFALQAHCARTPFSAITHSNANYCSYLSSPISICSLFLFDFSFFLRELSLMLDTSQSKNDRYTEIGAIILPPFARFSIYLKNVSRSAFLLAVVTLLVCVLCAFVSHFCCHPDGGYRRLHSNGNVKSWANTFAHVEPIDSGKKIK